MHFQMHSKVSHAFLFFPTSRNPDMSVKFCVPLIPAQITQLVCQSVFCLKVKGWPPHFIAHFAHPQNAMRKDICGLKSKERQLHIRGKEPRGCSYNMSRMLSNVFSKNEVSIWKGRETSNGSSDSHSFQPFNGSNCMEQKS